MATPEGKVKDMIKKLLKPYENKGLYYFMPVQGKFAKNGVPDFLLCYKGKFLAIEAKANGKADTTTALQDKTIEDINNSGGVASVVSCKEEMIEFIEKNFK